MHEHVASPHYIKAIWRFPYKGIDLEITTTVDQGKTVYSAWANYATGSAVVVPVAHTQTQAIAQAKQWIDTHFISRSEPE